MLRLRGTQRPMAVMCRRFWFWLPGGRERWTMVSTVPSNAEEPRMIESRPEWWINTTARSWAWAATLSGSNLEATAPASFSSEPLRWEKAAKVSTGRISLSCSLAVTTARSMVSSQGSLHTSLNWTTRTLSSSSVLILEDSTARLRLLPCSERYRILPNLVSSPGKGSFSSTETKFGKILYLSEQGNNLSR